MKTKKTNRTARTFEGLPVVDADKDMVIHVNAKDIANSIKKNPDKCAAANAGKRELRRDVKVFLSRMYVKADNGKKWIRYLTPSNAAREIVSFDRGSSFEPGDYKFKAASLGQRLGNSRSNNHKDTGNGHKRSQHITANVRVSAKEGWKKS